MVRSPCRLALLVLATLASGLSACRAPRDTAPWNRDDRVAAPASTDPAAVGRPRSSSGRIVEPAAQQPVVAEADTPAARRPSTSAASRRAIERAPTAEPTPLAPIAPAVPSTTVTVLDGKVRAAFDALVDAAWSGHGMPSVVVGVVHGDELVYTRAVGFADLATRRPAAVDTIYNLGSITKVFTTSLAGVLRDAGYFQLDDVVSRYLPAHVRLPTDPRGARAMTLRHLATHTSGLPGEPFNLSGVPGDPWNGYTIDQLYRALPDTELVAPIGAEVSYSNMGMALLGHVMARATGSNYAALMRDELLEPLGMHDTGLKLLEEQEARYATGYLDEDPEAEAVRWNLGCLAPAGGMASTVSDLARFVSLQFHAEEAGVVPISGGTLAELQRPQRMFDESWEVGIGLGWFIERSEEIGPVVRHNGGMGGHRGHLSIAPRHDVGVIVLSNRGWRTVANPVAELGAELLVMAVHALAAVGPEVFAAAEALGEQLRAGPDARLGDLFHPVFLERMSLNRLDRLFFGYREKGVRCTGIETILPTGEPNAAHIVYRMERGGPVGLVIQVDPQPPYQIISIVFDGPQKPKGEASPGAGGSDGPQLSAPRTSAPRTSAPRTSAPRNGGPPGRRR